MSDLIHDLFHNMTHSHVRDVAANMDAYLLEFFGSEENIKKFGHLYILETKEAEILTKPDTDDRSFSISMCTEYRLRLKTEEELTADKEKERS